MKERPHKYEVALHEDQRFVLQQLIAKGNAPVRQQAHARILLKIDRHAPGPRWTDEQVAEAFEMSRYTVIRIRERFADNGLDDALNHRLIPKREHEPWMESKKPISLPSRVAHVLQDKPAGRYVFWLTVWWNWAMWNT